ncbi:hypothetical protein GCM10023069_54480 [Shinella granuli]
MSDEKGYTSTATWGGMLALNHRLTVYCDPCGRSVEIDLVRFPPDEKATGRVFRCSLCGAKGRCIVSAPTPGAPKLAPGFYGAAPVGPRPEPIRKRRRRR